MRSEVLSAALLAALIISTPARAVTDAPAGKNTIIGQDGAPMVLVPAGAFTMGSSDDALLQKAPRHTVYLDAFYMDRHHVTNEQFARFLNAMKQKGEANPAWKRVVLRSDLQDERRKSWWPTEIIFENGLYKAFPGFERYPVNSVNWHGANDYCLWAGKRLPTEAEWEKAARGALQGKLYPWGNELPTDGVTFSRSWRDNQEEVPTNPVELYHPNGYGLYDMAGNLWQWCSDWYSADYYKKSPVKDPKGPQKGKLRILRGGSWYNSSFYLRVDYRHAAAPDEPEDGFGFRCAADADKNIEK